MVEWRSLSLERKDSERSLSVQKVGDPSENGAAVTIRKVDGSEEPSPSRTAKVRPCHMRDAGLLLATIEPMHGNGLVVYRVISGSFPEHCPPRPHRQTHRRPRPCVRRFAGRECDQIVVGWRGTPGKEGARSAFTFGLRSTRGERMARPALVDDNGMACEDLHSPTSMATASSTSSPPAARRRT